MLIKTVKTTQHNTYNIGSAGSAAEQWYMHSHTQQTQQQSLNC